MLNDPDMPLGSCSPISDDVLYSTLPFSKVNNDRNRAKIENPSTRVANTVKPFYLYGSAFRVELYETRKWDKCLTSFIVGDIFPIKSKAWTDSCYSNKSVKHMLIKNFDIFRLENMNMKLLTPSYNTKLSDISNIVIRISGPAKLPNASTSVVYVDILSPQFEHILGKTLCTLVYDNISGYLVHAGLKTLSSREVHISSPNSVIEIKSGKDAEYLKMHYSVWNLLILDIALGLDKEFGRREKELWNKVSKLAALNENIVREYYATRNIWLAFRTLYRGSRSTEVNHGPRGIDFTEIASPKYVQIRKLEEAIPEGVAGARRHLMSFISPVKFNRDTVDDLGTEVSEYGRFIIFENAMPSPQLENPTMAENTTQVEESSTSLSYLRDIAASIWRKLV